MIADNCELMVTRFPLSREDSRDNDNKDLASPTPKKGIIELQRISAEAFPHASPGGFMTENQLKLALATKNLDVRETSQDPKVELHKGHSG